MTPEELAAEIAGLTEQRDKLSAEMAALQAARDDLGAETAEHRAILMDEFRAIQQRHQDDARRMNRLRSIIR